MSILLEKLINKQRTCIDYFLCLLDGKVGLLLARSEILGNEVSENRNGFLYNLYYKVKNSQSDIKERARQHIKSSLAYGKPSKVKFCGP